MPMSKGSAALLFAAHSSIRLLPWMNGEETMLFAHRPLHGTRVLPLCVGLVGDQTVFSLAHALPSSTSAQNRSCLFGWFVGTMA